MDIRKSWVTTGEATGQFLCDSFIQRHLILNEDNEIHHFLEVPMKQVFKENSGMKISTSGINNPINLIM